MSKTTRDEARIIAQCANGYRLRYTYAVPFIVAAARTNMTAPNHALADVIQNETADKAVFIAPCNGKITRLSTNAVAWPAQGAGTLTATFKKAVIGDTDVALNTAQTLLGNTGDTAVDTTLSTTAGALDVIEGQLVYVEVVQSNNAATTRSNGLVFTAEFMPTEA